MKSFHTVSFGGNMVFEASKKILWGAPPPQTPRARDQLRKRRATVIPHMSCRIS